MGHFELGMNVAICQKWEESEGGGWGSRPDGSSIHLSEAGRAMFIKAYWDSMPDTPPDEYSRPDGEAYPIGIDDETVRLIEASEDGGIRIHDGMPGSGGVDGWIPREPSAS